MRVVGGRKRGQEKLSHFFCIELIHSFCKRRVSTVQFIFGVFVRRLFALLDQHAVLDSLPPPILKFRWVLCEFEFVRIRHHHFIQSEIMFTLDELIDHDQTFFNAFEKSVENGKSEGEVT